MKCPKCKQKFFSLKVILGYGEICEDCYNNLGSAEFFNDYKKALRELNEI